MDNNQTGPLPRTIAFFANMLAIVSTVYLLPTIAERTRGDIVAYISREIGYDWSFLLSWLVVLLLCVCIASGLSMALQLVFHSISKPRRPSNW